MVLPQGVCYTSEEDKYLKVENNNTVCDINAIGEVWHALAYK